MKEKNIRFSQAVRHKFLILLFLTLALMFDIIFRQPNSELLEDQSLPEMPKCQQQDNLKTLYSFRVWNSSNI